MTDYKFIIRFALIFLIAAFVVVAFIFYVDPFQVYNKTNLSGMKLNENKSYQDAGLINSYLADEQQHYDSAAFGTSASANFSAEELSRKLGWKKTSRLFLAGGSPAEIRQIASHAISTGKVKHVLLEMDLWIMNGEYRDADNPSFPRYLYNTSHFDDVRYFFDTQVFFEAIKTLLGLADTRNGTPELLGYWGDGDWVKGQHDGLNNKAHIDALSTDRLTLTPWSDEKISAMQYPALDNEMFHLLDQLCNSNIDVVLFIPPYSRLYILEKQKDIFTVIYEPRYILKKIDGCKNIRLHAFDNLEFTYDLNHYKDHRHYLVHVSNKLLEWMGKNEYIITLQNISVYEKQWFDALNNTAIHSSYPTEPHL